MSIQYPRNCAIGWLIISVCIKCDSWIKFTYEKRQRVTNICTWMDIPKEKDQ